MTFEQIYSGKTYEQIKTEVLTDLYLNGKLTGGKKSGGMYMGIKSKSNINPLKAFINRYLTINRLNDIDNDFCEECYQTAFMHISAKPPEKIAEILQKDITGKWLCALMCRIIINRCFSVKNNPKSSGLIHNLLNNSSYGNIPVSTSEVFDDIDLSGDGLIIYDEPEPDAFSERYNISVEDFINLMNDDDKEFFYSQLLPQKVGKPKKSLVEKKQKFYQRVRNIKENLPKNN